MQEQADWSAIYTAEKFTKEFKLEFSGPGMYLTKTDTLLVVPLPPNEETTRDNIWYQTQPAGTVYRVSVFNAPFEQTFFAAASVPPTRIDTRR